MREVIFKERGQRSLNKDLLFLVVGLILSILLGLSPLDNTFWYKSALLLYAFSSLFYWVSLIVKEGVVSVSATFSLYLALLLNLGAMVSRSYQSYKMGIFHPPWSNLFEALTFWTFIGGTLYLFIERRYGVRVLGALTLPILTLIYAFAIFKANKQITPLMPALRSYWLYVHVLTAFLGYAGFTVSFGSSVAYLIKTSKRFNRLKRFLPSEEVLDEITYKSIAISFPIWTASIILGAAWANEAWGSYWSWDPKETWSLIVWFFFGAYLHARQIMGWRGKRTAYLSIIGFIAVLICFFAINLYFPGLHSYATD